MARLPALIARYAECDGRPRKTIGWYARVAREAGKLPTTKRGSGAAHMGVPEVVNLLLACNVAEEAKDGPRIIEQLRSLRPRPSENAADLESHALRAVVSQPDLGSALEELVRRSPELFDDLKAIVKRENPNADEDFYRSAVRRSIGIDVTLWRYGAEIEYWRSPGVIRTPEICMKYLPDVHRMFNGFYAPEPSQDRTVRVILSFRTFLRLAELVLDNASKLAGEIDRSTLVNNGGGDG